MLGNIEAMTCDVYFDKKAWNIYILLVLCTRQSRCDPECREKTYLPSFCLHVFGLTHFGAIHRLINESKFVLLIPLYVLLTFSEDIEHQPRKYMNTVSIDWGTMYRVTVTGRGCPIRCTRSIAWASTAGFQCGSTKWTWFAAVRSTLRCVSMRY